MQFTTGGNIDNKWNTLLDRVEAAFRGASNL